MMKKIVAGCLSIAVMLFLVSYFLLFTEWGCVFLVNSGEKYTQGRLQVGKISGHFGREFSLSDVSYRGKETSIMLENITMIWSAGALLQGKVNVSSIAISGVTVDSSSAGEKDADKIELQSLPQFTIPLAITIERFQLTDVAILQDRVPLAHVESFFTTIRNEGSNLVIPKLLLKGDGLDLKLAGEIAVADDWQTDIQGQWQYSSKKTGLITGDLAVSQSLKDGSARFQIFSPIKVNAVTKFTVADEIIFSTELTLDGGDPALVFEGLNGKIDAAAKLNGKFNNDGFSAFLHVQAIEGDIRGYPIHAQGEISYDNSVFSVNAASIKSKNTVLQIDGTAGQTIDINYTINSSDLADILSGVMGSVLVQGNFHGSTKKPVFVANAAGENLVIAGFKIKHLSAKAAGAVTSEGPVKLTAEFKGLQYQEQLIDEAKLGLSGNLENHKITLNLFRDSIEAELEGAGRLDGKSWTGMIDLLNIRNPSEGEMRLEKSVSLAIQQKSGALTPVCLAHDSGRLCLSGEWSSAGWLAQLDVSDFDPAVFFGQDWSGKIDTRLTGKGSIGADQQSVEVRIEECSGILREVVISAAGDVQLRDNKTYFNNIKLDYGDAHASLNGELSTEYDLTFIGEIPDLNKIAPQLKGQISFSGDIAGKRDTPIVHLQFNGRENVINSIEIAEISGKINLEEGSDAPVNSEILVKDVSVDTFSIYEASINISGSAGKHVFALNVSSSEGIASVTGNGKYTTFWQGFIDNASLTAGRYGDFNFRNGTEISVSSEKSTIDNLCVSGMDLDLCLMGSLVSMDEWHVEGIINSFSLNQLNRYDIVEIPLTGNLTGSIIAENNAAAGLSFDGKAEVDALQLMGEIEGKQYKFRFKDSSVVLHLKESILNSSIDFSLEKGGGFKGVLEVSEIFQNDDWYGSSPVKGEFSLNLDDLTIFSVLSQSEIESTGGLDGHFVVNGTVKTPLINGDLAINDGTVKLQALGITLSDLNMDMNANNDRIDFNLSAVSGPGKASGKGTLSFTPDKQWQINGQLAGNNFEILNTSEYKIQVNPEIELNLDKNSGQMTGEIIIPTADIALLGGSSAITPSNDVVIIDQPEANNTWQLFSNVRLLLGENISINAYGLKSKLVGDLYLRDQPGKALSAEGELDVIDGKFSLYSVELDIQRGKLVFAGGSVDNPGVDFRAQRVVDKKTVGVDVGGTAQNLEFQLFSDPVMEESDILAYIMVGRSVYASEENEQSLIGAAATALGVRGVNEITSRLGTYLPIDEIYLDGSSSKEDMSLVLGKHLTEDLFVGYDHNFFDATGEFRVNYNLGKGFSFETRSSGIRTSGDILYSIKH